MRASANSVVKEAGADQDFADFEPLFWRVLSALARHGFVASPMDTRDLVHDFYVEAWNGVKEHFNSELGSFATYLASAFYKFSRRRIVSLQSWRQRSVDIDLLADRASEDATPLQAVERKEQLEAIRAALARLPSLERSVLQDYLSDAEFSERAIAQRHSMSRYALRECLLNAVGRTAVEVGRLDPKSPESLVAFHLWHEGRSAKNISSLLDIPVSDVQSLKSRFAGNLLSSIRSVQSTRSHGDTTMATSLELLKRTLLRVGDEDSLGLLRMRSQDLLLLDEQGDFDLSPEQLRALEDHPEWVAHVYETLGIREDSDDEPSSVQAAIDMLRDEEEKEIGEAFVALLQALPGEFRAWNNFFGDLLAVTPDEQDYLLEDPSFVEGVPDRWQLAKRGLTPLMFFSAVRGLELLFDRLIESGRPQERQDLTDPLLPEVFLSMRDSMARLQASLLVGQVSTTAGLRPDAAPMMANWVLHAMFNCPDLVRGYRARPIGVSNMLLEQLETPAHRFSSDDDLVRRWSRVSMTFGRYEVDASVSMDSDHEVKRVLGA